MSNIIHWIGKITSEMKWVNLPVRNVKHEPDSLVWDADKSSWN